MELDLIFAANTVLAGVTCLTYCKTTDEAVPFLRSDFFKFFCVVALSGGAGLMGGVFGALLSDFTPSLDFLFPLVSSVTALGTVLLVWMFIKNTENAGGVWLRKCSLLTSMIFSLITGSAFDGEAFGEFILPATVSAVIYITFASLIYGTCAFLVPDTDAKRGKMYPKIMILTSSIGFAAEGFKGIFENLFT